MIIQFEIEDEKAVFLAMGHGWRPEVEDTEGELVGDEYPKIPNPVTIEQFIAGVIMNNLQDYVLREGRKRVINEIETIKESVEQQVQSGTFDAFILANDIDSIKLAMLRGLSGKSS